MERSVKNQLVFHRIRQKGIDSVPDVRFVLPASYRSPGDANRSGLSAWSPDQRQFAFLHLGEIWLAVPSQRRLEKLTGTAGTETEPVAGFRWKDNSFIVCVTKPSVLDLLRQKPSTGNPPVNGFLTQVKLLDLKSRRTEILFEHAVYGSSEGHPGPLSLEGRYYIYSTGTAVCIRDLSGDKSVGQVNMFADVQDCWWDPTNRKCLVRIAQSSELGSVMVAIRYLLCDAGTGYAFTDITHLLHRPPSLPRTEVVNTGIGASPWSFDGSWFVATRWRTDMVQRDGDNALLVTEDLVCVPETGQTLIVQKECGLAPKDLSPVPSPCDNNILLFRRQDSLVLDITGDFHIIRIVRVGDRTTLTQPRKLASTTWASDWRWTSDGKGVILYDWKGISFYPVLQ